MLIHATLLENRQTDRCSHDRILHFASRQRRKHPRAGPGGFTGSDRRTRVPAESCRGRVSSPPISGSHCRPRPSMELREPYGFFAVLRQSAFAKAKRNRLAISHASRYYLEMLRFAWDERKNKSEHEDRFILLGVSSAARTLIVVHCYKDNDSVVRIISARKATRKGVRFYEEGISFLQIERAEEPVRRKEKGGGH